MDLRPVRIVQDADLAAERLDEMPAEPAGPARGIAWSRHGWTGAGVAYGHVQAVEGTAHPQHEGAGGVLDGVDGRLRDPSRMSP